MTIKTIIFDLFGVIYKDRWKEFLYVYENNLSDFLKNDQVPYIKEFNFTRNYPDYYNQLIKYNTDIHDSLCKISNDEFYNILSQASKIDKEEIISMIHDKSVFNSEIISNIKYFKNLGYQIGILTNGNNSITNEFLEAGNIKFLFDFIMTSEEAGAQKPDPIIYSKILKKIGNSASETIFIDDTEMNTRSARNLGIHAIDYENQSNQELNYLIQKIIDQEKFRQI